MGVFYGVCVGMGSGGVNVRCSNLVERLVSNWSLSSVYIMYYNIFLGKEFCLG